MIEGKTNYVEGAIEAKENRVIGSVSGKRLVKTSCMLVPSPMVAEAVSKYELRGYTVKTVHKNNDESFSISATKIVAKSVL